MFRSVILSVLLLGAAGGRLGASTSAEARAKVWLRQHQSPDEQGLNDLKNSDPNSYAIVQALLAKQQMGLLDPSNPGGQKHEEHESAADIMRSAPSIAGVAPEVPDMSELAVSAPVTHHSYTGGNPLAFNAHKADDDVMSIIDGGDHSSSAEDQIQPISQMVMSAPVLHSHYNAQPAVSDTNQAVLSVLSGGDPEPSGSTPGRRSYMSEISMPTPMRRAVYSPPVQHASYSRGNPLAFNSHKSDDDLMSIIDGGAPPSNTYEAPQPISEVAISAPVQRAVYTPPAPVAPVQRVYTPPVQRVEYTPPVQRYTPPVQQVEYAPTASLISSRRSTDAYSSASGSADDLMAMVRSGADLGAPSAQYVPPAPVQSMEQSQPSQSYYGVSMDWGKQSAPTASMSQQGSYLSSINFPTRRGEEPASAPTSNSDSLQSFSWNEYADVASGRVQVRRPAQTQMMQQQQQAQEEAMSESELAKMDEKFEKTKIQGALSDWLAPMHQAPAPRNSRAAEQQEESLPGDKVDPMAIDKYNEWAHSGSFQ